MDSFLPLLTYAVLSLLVLLAAFKAARAWSWPLLGYAIIGFFALLIISYAELTPTTWLLIASPVFLGLIALLWRQMSDWTVETSPKSITISVKDCDAPEDDTCCCGNN